MVTSGCASLTAFDAFGRGNEYQRLDVFAAFRLQQVNSGHHRAAGREHGVDNQRGAFVHAVHEFFKIGNGFERFFVALQSDHADFGSRNQVEHAVEHTQTGNAKSARRSRFCP